MTFEELLAKYEPALAKAFGHAIDEIKSAIVMRVVVERLERGDIDGAISAMQLDPDAYSALEIAIAEAYNAGGVNLIGELPKLAEPEGARVVFRFGVRNLEGETWLRDHSARLVTRINDDQRLGIRQALEDGLSRGLNPRTTALDVVGRIDRTSGRRTGGVIGLTSPQERYVSSARKELLSGDPAQLRNYLGRERRDKRFDRTVLKALRDEKPLTADEVSRITGRYADRLLELRGEMLARTETMMALGTARENAMRQQIDAGKVAAQDVKKRWHSAGDNRVRHTHRILNGQAVGIDDNFVSVSGARLRYPGDPDAPINEISGCRCYCEYDVDYIAAGLRKYRARVG